MDMEMAEIKKFVGYASEAAGKVREAAYLLTGSDYPEEGSILHAVYHNIFDMLQMVLSPVVGKEIHSDGFNNMVTEILFAEESQIGSIIEKYCEAGS